jgi:hypothetical protein
VTPLVRSGGRWRAGGASSRVGCAWRSAVALLPCAMEFIMFQYALAVLLLALSITLIIAAVAWHLWPLMFLSGMCALCSYFSFTVDPKEF